jgi:energy-coupling factor transport system substrate-specific component
MVLLLIPIAVAINIIGGQIIALLKLPIYLDAIGTLLVAILAGVWPGIITGVLSNGINAIFAPDFFPFTIVAIFLAIAAGLLSRAGMFRTIPKAVISALIIAVVATVTAAPIVAYVFGGVTGSGSTAIVAALQAGGSSLLEASVLTSLLTDVVDKSLSVAVCYIIIKSLPSRYLVAFPLGRQYAAEGVEEEDEE